MRGLLNNRIGYMNNNLQYTFVIRIKNVCLNGFVGYFFNSV